MAGRLEYAALIGNRDDRLDSFGRTGLASSTDRLRPSALSRASLKKQEADKAQSYDEFESAVKFESLQNDPLALRPFSAVCIHQQVGVGQWGVRFFMFFQGQRAAMVSPPFLGLLPGPVGKVAASGKHRRHGLGVVKATSDTRPMPCFPPSARPIIFPFRLTPIILSGNA